MKYITPEWPFASPLGLEFFCLPRPWLSPLSFFFFAFPMYDLVFPLCPNPQVLKDIVVAFGLRSCERLRYPFTLVPPPFFSSASQSLSPPTIFFPQCSPLFHTTGGCLKQHGFPPGCVYPFFSPFLSVDYFPSFFLKCPKMIEQLSGSSEVNSPPHFANPPVYSFVAPHTWNFFF